MIPDSFVRAIELPLLPNSDVNRALLRDQFDYWLGILKDYSRGTNEGKHTVDLVQDSVSFSLDPQSIEALVKLASEQDVPVATMFTSVFAIALESDFIVETDAVNGFGDAKRTQFVWHSRNEECKAGILSSTLNHIKQSFRYRYLSLDWIKEIFNELNKNSVKILFNSKLIYSQEESDPAINEHISILLKVKDPNSLDFVGQWFFNTAVADKKSILKLNEKINKYLLWINDDSAVTIEDLKSKAANEARNKLISVKRKFSLGSKQVRSIE